MTKVIIGVAMCAGAVYMARAMNNQSVVSMRYGVIATALFVFAIAVVAVEGML